MATSSTPIGATQRFRRAYAMHGGTWDAAYSWFYMSDEERTAYTVWKNSGGVFGVNTSEGAMPRNWAIMNSGTISGVAKRDVGMIGLRYLDKSQEHMNAGGTQKVFDSWLEMIGAHA